MWALVYALSVAACAAPTNSLPERPTVAGEVAIFRDQWGVPHVYATSDEDVIFGAAYAYAEDDLEGLLRAFLMVDGRAAARFGRSELNLDLFSRQWQIRETAEAAYQRLDPNLRSLLRAYAAGVERYLSEHPELRPSELPEIQPYHPLGVAYWLSVFISVQQDRQGLHDCTVSGAVMTPDVTQHDPADAVRLASNQWVLMPSRTRDRVLIMWADSHSPFNDLIGRREMRLHGASLHTAGVQVAGLLVPIIATTPRVAWGLAVGGPDVSDCYEILLEPGGDPQNYRVDGHRRRVVERDETISVAGENPVVVRFEAVEVNGLFAPVVARAPGRLYVVSTGYVARPEGLIRQLLAMNRARDLQDFKRALQIQGFFPQNIMAGDANGHAYYISAGLVPIRPAREDWTRAVSGNTRGTEWRGFHRPDELVQLEDPRAGYMFNTNTAADTITNGPDRPRAQDYRTYIFNDLPGRLNERGRRAAELLSSAQALSVEDVLAIGFDEMLPLTSAWQQALRMALKSAFSLAPEVEVPAGELLAFDGFTHSESTRALAYYRWREAIVETARESGTDPEALAALIEAGRKPAESESEILLRSLARAAEIIAQAPDGASTPAGDMFRIGRGDVSLPIGGFGVPRGTSYERTLRALFCRAPPGNQKPCSVISGQRHPILTVFSTPPRSYMAVPWGQSGAPDSAHFSDQSVLASTRQLKPIYLEWEELRPMIRKTLVLKTGLTNDP